MTQETGVVYSTRAQRCSKVFKNRKWWHTYI